MDPVKQHYGWWVALVIFTVTFFLFVTGISVWAIVELVNWVVSQ